ncbi:flagellar hook-length control protein FliK [Jannaschia rubra]|uniref:flagellar hook-length control protein FliK n=1 Tax=Jannaschia rubra TaxID=282197 RepID=UPI002491CC99|nr:flagellar hook-length control protein FliK [Jannaschia rubra]
MTPDFLPMSGPARPASASPSATGPSDGRTSDPSAFRFLVEDRSPGEPSLRDETSDEDTEDAATDPLAELMAGTTGDGELPEWFVQALAGPRLGATTASGSAEAGEVMVPLAGNAGVKAFGTASYHMPPAGISSGEEALDALLAMLPAEGDGPSTQSDDPVPSSTKNVGEGNATNRIADLLATFAASDPSAAPALSASTIPDSLSEIGPRALASLPALSAEGASSPPSVPLSGLRDVLARQVQALAAEASTTRGADGSLSTELELAPAELGKLRIVLQTGERGLHLTVAVERPESLDAVKRHLDGLHRSLLADGVTLDGIDIGAENHGRGGERTVPGHEAPGRIGSPDEDGPPPPPADIRLRRPVADGRLDLSL